jgi:hypothetical protein
VTVGGLASLGQLVLPPGATRTIGVRVLDAPAASTTPLGVTSSDPSTAIVLGTPQIPAGSTDAQLAIAAGTAGEAILLVSGSGVRRELKVVVTLTPARDQSVPLLAPPVGLTVGGLTSVGQVSLSPGATHTLRLRLLDVPAAANTPVLVTSENAAVAAVAGPADVAAGSREVNLPIAAGSAGETVLVLRAGSLVRELKVVVAATPASDQKVPVLAPPVGVRVEQP